MDDLSKAADALVILMFFMMSDHKDLIRVNSWLAAFGLKTTVLHFMWLHLIKSVPIFLHLIVFLRWTM